MIIRYIIVGVVAFLAWGITQKFDGPIVHFALTALAVWLAWTMTAGMAGGGSE